MKHWVVCGVLCLLWTCCASQGVCEEPPDIDFGEIVSYERRSYRAGARTNYRCNLGYVLEGSEWITCIRRWQSPPKCLAPCTITRKQLNAKNLLYSTGRGNSQMIQSNRTLEFKCREGYMIRGPSVRKCVDGHLDLPLCISAGCEPPPRRDYEELSDQSNKEAYSHGDTVLYNCRPGYIKLRQIRYRCNNGNWEQVPPFVECRIAVENCSRPPSIENGDVLEDVTSQFMAGSTVHYKCQSLYVMSGSSEVQCVNGQWTETPTCIAPCIATDEEMQRHNIQFKWKPDPKLYIKSGDMMEFACRRGFQLAPSSPPLRVQCIEGNFEYPRCI